MTENFIRVSGDGWHFEEASSGRPFVPIGTNYCAVIEAIETGGYCGQVFPLFGRDEHTETDPVEEARRAFSRLADLGMNVVRTWLEPSDFFPVGLRLDSEAADRFDAVIAAASDHSIRLSVGLHLCPIASRGFSAGRIRSFEPPHRQRLIEHLHLLAGRWGNEPAIFSWTIVGEGTLPWRTPWMENGWPAFLQYWYDDDLDSLRSEWGAKVSVPSFAEAPVPPRNIGATLPLGAVNPGNLASLPEDEWAGSTWRYDWRLYLEEIGSAWIAEQVRALRTSGARQMIAVGNNSWTFPGLPVGQMALGFNPFFYLDSVDYLCQHNYPAPQCLPGGTGDPLDSEEAMQTWLAGNEVMGRIYGSLGKPVVMEEWGWYGGGESRFLTPLPFRSEEDQSRYSDRMMESMQSCFAGWIYWQWRDMPRAADITNFSGLYAADGTRLKPWGQRYGECAARRKQNPPALARAKAVVGIPMREFTTSDRFHETWWQTICRDYPTTGPLDFRLDFERKPLVRLRGDKC